MTRPVTTGSAPTANTIGITEVADFAGAGEPGEPGEDVPLEHAVTVARSVAAPAPDITRVRCFLRTLVVMEAIVSSTLNVVRRAHEGWDVRTG